MCPSAKQTPSLSEDEFQGCHISVYTPEAKIFSRAATHIAPLMYLINELGVKF